MKTVYFVRHGQSQANIDRVFAGSMLDSPLTVKGMEQADQTAAALRGKVFDVIVASPLARAKTTAERIARQLGYEGEIALEPLLRERNLGTVTGMTWELAGDIVDKGTAEGMETLEQLAERMQQMLTLLRTMSGKSILVVGHGTTESMMRTIYLGQPFATFLQTKELGNAEVREYVFD